MPRYIFIRKIFTQRSSHLLANVAYLYLFCEIRSLVDKQEVRTLHACGTYSVTRVPGSWEETELPPISSRKRLICIMNHHRKFQINNCPVYIYFSAFRFIHWCKFCDIVTEQRCVFCGPTTFSYGISLQPYAEGISLIIISLLACKKLCEPQYD